MFKQFIKPPVIIAFFCALLLSTTLCAKLSAENAALPDPMASLHPTDNITNLAKLRPLIQQDPQNMDLLGRVLMSYVNLCLNGEARNEGKFGPWLDYAQVIFQQREKLREQKPALTLSDVVPDLWHLAVSGYMADAHQRLLAYETENDSEAYRALLALTTYDYRPLHKKFPTTVHGKYALLRAEFQTKARLQSSRFTPGRERIYNPMMIEFMNYREGYSGDMKIIVSESLALTVWILASQELTDDVAISQLMPLAKALQVPNEAAPKRKALWRATYQAALDTADSDKVPVEAIGIAADMLEKFCRNHGESPFPKNPQSLYGFRDLAFYARDIIYMAFFFTYNQVRESGNGSAYARGDKEFYDVVKKVAPDAMITARLGVGLQKMGMGGNDKSTPERWDQFAARAEKLVNDSAGSSHASVIYELNKLAVGRAAKAAELLGKHLSYLDHIPRAELERIGEIADKDYSTFDLARAVQHWSEQSPMDHDLLEMRQRFSPDSSIFVSPDTVPIATWIDHQINQVSAPKNYPAQEPILAVCWTGYLRIEKDGYYEFGIDARNAARAVIGDLVINNFAVRKKQMTQRGKTFVAGDYPLRLEFTHRVKGSHFRFLCKTPESGELQVVPAEWLSHGEKKAPGLAGRAWKIPDRKFESAFEVPFSEQQRAYAMENPHQLHLLYAMGHNLFSQREFEKALPFFRLHFDQKREYYFARRLAQCYLFQKNTDIESALSVLRQGVDLRHEAWQIAQMVNIFRHHGRIQDFYKATTKVNADDSLWPYIEGYYFLDQGKLPLAAQRLSKMCGKKTAGWNFDYEHYITLLFEAAIIGRINKTKTDMDHVISCVEHSKRTEEFQITLDYLQGFVSEDEAIAATAANKAGEKIYYYAGLVAFTQGRFDHAKKRFSEFLARWPDELESTSCLQLTRWIEQNAASAKPEDFAAPPLPKGAKKPGTVTPGADDF
jgi:tetratricopeptide (TPR) repeat protein